MHTVMSFIGCLGTLIKWSGLEEILNVAFNWVSNKLNGKSWPKSLRCFRMAVAVLFERYILSGKKSVVEFEVALEKDCRTPTEQLWVECFIKPVMIVHLYIRAECEGNLHIHLYCCEQMVSYFPAAGHWQYLIYVILYILEMRYLVPQEGRQMYLGGHHVCRHNEGHGIMFSVTSLESKCVLRCGKAIGDLVGKTLSWSGGQIGPL